MKKINIVLYQPEIPQNTGNIMRSCVGFNAKLHLIKPLGFSLDDKHMKRSSVDYLEYLDWEVYENIDDFRSKNHGEFFYLTRYGHKTPKEISLEGIEGPIYFMFGKESTGIPYDILKENLDRCYRIPTTDDVRSLNLSNCVAIMLYEASEKLNFEGLIAHEPEKFKGEFFLDNYKMTK
ncbi:MAG: tRNA (cytidine(34)-2'-O)-methyltransferase [Anaeroplasmataceae bacterium]